MRKLFIVAIFLVGLLALVVHAQPVEAAFFRFNPASVSAVSGSTFQVSVVVDSGSDEILSSDAYILFDSKLLNATGVNDGSYFPYVVHNITPGKVSIRGLVTDAATSRTGSGTLATINFQVLAPGSASLSFFCDMNASDTSKIVKNDINATNIIVCTQNNTASVTLVTPTPAPSGTTTGTVTPSPTPTTASTGNGGANNAGTSGTGTGNSSGGTGPGNGGNASIGTGQNVDNTRPTALPKSGAFDNLGTLGIAGTALIILGGVVSLIL